MLSRRFMPGGASSSSSFLSPSAAASDIPQCLSRLIGALLGRSFPSEALGLYEELADGVVLAELATLGRPLGSLSIGRETSPQRRRDNLTRLFDVLRSAGLLPVSSRLCATPSDAARSAAEIVRGGDPGRKTLFELSMEFLVSLQLARIADYYNDGGASNNGGVDYGAGTMAKRSPTRRPFAVRNHAAAPRSLADLQRWLVAWCAELVRGRGIKVWNCGSSLQDGKALLALLQALHVEEKFDPMEHPPVS